MEFIYFFFFYYWFLVGFYKITDLDKPNSWLRDSITKKGRFWDFMYKLSECQYCMESHIGFILSIPIVYLNVVNFQGFEFYIIGWISAGILQLIKWLKYND